MNRQSPWDQLVLALIGGLLTIVGALVFGLLGVPSSIANVAGISLAMPLFAYILNSATFDTEQYFAETPRTRQLLDGAIIAAASFIAGAGSVLLVTVLSITSDSSVLMALGSAVTFLVGLGGFQIHLSEYIGR